MHGFFIFIAELIFLCSFAKAFNIKGFRYGDNKEISKWVEGKNGYALAKIEEFFPKQLSVCFRGFPEWNRHGHRTNWVDFKLNIPDLRTKFSFLADFSLHSTLDIFHFQCGLNDKSTRTHNCYIPFHPAPQNFPAQNMLRKWVHICMSINVDKSTVTLYRDGELMSEQEIDIVELFPVGYFEEAFRTNGTYLPGYDIRFGVYPFDNQPLFGYIADINVWDRSLTAQEMTQNSGCKTIQPTEGNIVNMNSKFIITGTLIGFVDIDSENMECTETRKDFLMAAGANSLNHAVRGCDKFMENSLGPNFRTQTHFWR